MTFSPHFLILITGVSLVLSACLEEEPLNNRNIGENAELVELEEYDTIVEFEDEVLLMPIFLKFDNSNGRLLVFDFFHIELFEFNRQGDLVNRFGRSGSGPGEFRSINNIFQTESYNYFFDPRQLVIHRYDRSGDHVDSRLLDNLDSPNFGSGAPLVTPNENAPYISSDGSVLLPSLNKGRSLFERSDWEGNHLADIGEIPDSSLKVMEDEAYRLAIDNLDVPPLDYTNAFPVNDVANPGQYFIVYNSIPKIAKYNEEGQKLWEADVPEVPEIIKIAENLKEFFTVRYAQIPDAYRMTTRKYAWGVSSPNGDLFLATYNYVEGQVLNLPMLIHQFNSEGNLVRRFKIVAEVDMMNSFDIDFDERRFLVLPFQRGEIWAYPF